MDTKRILAAVDNFSTQAYLKDVFKHFSIKANWAWGWNGTVMHLEKGDYDALLLDDLLIPHDIQRPAEWLRDRGHHIPVITMTEKPVTQYVKDSAGVAIHKPVSPLRLMEALDSVTRNNNNRQNNQTTQTCSTPRSPETKWTFPMGNIKHSIRSIERSEAL